MLNLSITVDEIIQRMKKAYFEKTGKEVVPFSDFDVRLAAVADEVYSAFAYGEYIFKQAFVQTATGEYLNKHALLRGIERKKACPSAGKLKFFVSQAVENDVSVPSGTVCSVLSKPYIQFVTTAEAVIKAGDLFCVANAVSIDSGSRFNALANEVNVIVNPPEYVQGVVNETSFSGGSDDETDESLRRRVLNSYINENNGVNTDSMENAVLKFDGVLDVNIYPSEPNVTNVCVKTKSNELSTELTENIKNSLGFITLCGGNVNVGSAEAKSFDAYADITVYSGCDFERVRAQAEEKIKNYCGKEKIGSEINASAVARFIGNDDDIVDASVTLSPSAAGTVVCNKNQFLRLGNVRVTVHEQ